MPKDYAKFVPPKSNTSSNPSNRASMALFALFVLATSIAISYFLYEKKVLKIPGEKASISGFLAYAAASVLHHNKPIVTHSTNKQVAQNVDASAVQFDFYNDLPNMQMSVTDDDKENTQNVKIAATSDQLIPKEDAKSAETPLSVADKKTIESTLAESNDVKAAASEQVENQTKSELATNNDNTQTNSETESDKIASLFDPDEVSKQLGDEVNKAMESQPKVSGKNSKSEEVRDVVNGPMSVANAPAASSSRYVLQLGSFETESGAKRLQEALASVGFETNIVENNKNNQTVYRVQQGPFETKNLAESSRQQLQRRGIVSVLRRS